MLSKVMRRIKQGSWFFVGFGGLLILNLKTVIDERQKGVPFVLAQHMERKHSANIFSCDKCKFTSTSEYWFKQHAKAHNGKEINCDVCKKCFSSARNLKAHKDGVHGLPKL